MPVPTAGNAIVFSPFCAAMRRECAVELRNACAEVRPPSSMLAAWITWRAFKFPPDVIAAPPTGIVPISSHSAWICGPPLRRIAPATPPPSCRSLFAALTIASVSISVRSPCRISIRSARNAAPIALLRASVRLRCARPLRARNAVFVESHDHASAGNDHGPPNQVRFLGHHTDRLSARRWIFLHLFFAIDIVARVQKLRVVAPANQFFELGRTQRSFARSRKYS